MIYQGPTPNSDNPESLGVLLINLGTPDSTEVSDVRRYLNEFLSDPRVVEQPRLLWWLVLHGIILRIRPKRSARAYEKIWTDEGSPLLTFSRKLTEALQIRLEHLLPNPAKVVLAMRYGNPSIAKGLESLRLANARRVIVLPLYPQYSATTTASTFDAVSSLLQGWRWIPELKFINQYHRRPVYIQALAESVRETWQTQGEAERLLISFHGIPERYVVNGDPYRKECEVTAGLLAEQLALEDSRWALTFQSRMGREVWTKPYTGETLRRWGAEGVKWVSVICPGFAVDCLETLEEIAIENRDTFLSAGGETYHYIPALNDSAGHVELLSDIILDQVQ